MSQLFQTAALALALFYSSLIASNTPFELFGEQYDTHASKELLGAVALSVMALFGVGVLFRFLSRNAALGIRKGYTSHCTAELVRKAVDGKFGDLSAERISSLTTIAKSNSMYCGRVAYLYVLAAPEFVIMVVSLVGLLYLESTLTLLLSVVFMLAGVFIYRTTLRGAKRSVLSDRYNPRARNAIRESLQKTEHANQSKQISENEDFASWLDNFVGKIRSVEEGGLVAGLTTAVLLAVLLGGLVLDMMHEGSGWGRIVVYLVLFKVTTTQLGNLVRRMVSINRFYPQARVYWEVTTSNKIPDSLNEGGGLLEDDGED